MLNTGLLKDVRGREWRKKIFNLKLAKNVAGAGAVMGSMRACGWEDLGWQGGETRSDGWVKGKMRKNGNINIHDIKVFRLSSHLQFFIWKYVCSFYWSPRTIFLLSQDITPTPVPSPIYLLQLSTPSLKCLSTFFFHSKLHSLAVGLSGWYDG